MINVLKKAKGILSLVLTKKVFFISSIFILFLLLCKNPYSQRTLIPNLEPYPDTIHYINSAQSFLKGYGLKITRDGKSITNRVPPLYPSILIPFFILSKNPQNFYFANILLSFLSLIIFYKIIKKFTDNKWIIGLSLFLYVTNYYIYWYPNWAMAENLLLPIFLTAIYLFILEVNTQKIIAAALIGILLYATKYAAGPLTFLFLAIYGLKIVFETKGWKSKLKNSLIFSVSVIIFATTLLFIETQIDHGKQIFWLINNIWGTKKELISSSKQELISSRGGWFSIGYFLNNFKAYFAALRGEPIRFIWDFQPIFPIWLGNLGLVGLLIAFISKKMRRVSFILIILLFVEIAFISLFYAQDARFIIYAIPTILLGVTFSLELLRSFFSKIKIEKFFPILIILVFSFYLVGSVMRIKSQIMINLKYAEVPWSYISVLKMNDYFQSDKIVNNKKPFVITPMVPHFIDFYSNKNYNLLPLSDQQAFFGEGALVWGDYNYSDLLGVYKKIIKDGYPVYFARYGLGNEGYLHAAFDKIAQNFKLTKVYEGCYTECNIYKLEIKR